MRRERFGMVGCAVVGLLVTAAGAEDRLAQYVAAFNAADVEHYTNAIPNAAAGEFLARNVPRLECPDAAIERAYYFRWWTFRKHLKRTADGWVVTEFLPPVPWAGAENTIVCPFGHHLLEGRWLKDATILRDYLAFMMAKGTIVGERSYVSWPARGYLKRRKVVGPDGDGAALLPRFVARYEAWEKGWDFRGYPMRFEAADGLFHCADNREGMEHSVSGSGARVLVNAAMAAEARAISCLAAEAGDIALSGRFAAKAASLEQNVREKLWNPRVGFFTTRTDDGRQAGVREIQGYAPWYFELPLGRRFAAAWNPLVDPAHFLGACGLTTADRSDPGYRVAYEGHPCQWNGPSWPYTTAMTLTSLANAIRGGESGTLGAADYVRLLRLYAASHRRKLADGRAVDWIDENQDPETGVWISREMLLKRGERPIERGKDYNHSTFCDLVISGLAGFTPKANGTFTVSPLFPADWSCFRLTDIPWRGHAVGIVWEKGMLRVEVDGRCVARRDGLGELSYAPYPREFIAPAVTGHVHASTLLPLKDGGYLAAWFEGTKESNPDVAIKGAFRRNGRWSEKRVLAKVNPDSPHWNPVLRRADDGRISLYFKVGRNCSDWRTYLIESKDEGMTWSEPRELVLGEVRGGRGPVRNKCLRLPSGRWLAPASREIGLWRAFIDRSDDDGRTWMASEPIRMPDPDGKDGVIQPTLWLASDGRVRAYMRSNTGFIWASESADDGVTWAPARKTTLPNNNSGIDLVKASDGCLYLVMNTASGNWSSRSELEIWRSPDEGATWRPWQVLERERTGEFSYPCILEPVPGTLAVTYTWKRQRIAFVELRLP